MLYMITYKPSPKTTDLLSLPLSHTTKALPGVNRNALNA